MPIEFFHGFFERADVNRVFDEMLFCYSYGNRCLAGILELGYPEINCGFRWFSKHIIRITVDRNICREIKCSAVTLEIAVILHRLSNHVLKKVFLSPFIRPFNVHALNEQYVHLFCYNFSCFATVFIIKQIVLMYMYNTIV